MKTVLVLMMVLLTGAASASVGWRNLDDAHRLGGRLASEGYLCGKVVLVDRWGFRCPPCRALLPRVEEIWQSFKTKPFVVLGGHCRGWGSADEVKRLIGQNGLTYPIYEDAGLAKDEPAFDAIPFLYVVDETGKVVYQGHSERDATQAVVMALTDMESPRSVEQLKRFLDFELENLPGRAYLRANEFRKTHPQEAKAYFLKFRELVSIPHVKELSELVTLARQTKDAPAFGAKEQAKRAVFKADLKKKLAKYAFLTDSADPRVAQEAKNSLADIKWALAAL